MNIGSILARSFSILSGRPGIFLALAFISILPAALVRSIGSGQRGLLPTLLIFLFGMLVQGAFASAVYRIRSGDKDVTLAESISHGFSRALPLGCAVMLVAAGVALGAMLFLIPGLMLLCMWAVTIPVCAMEGLGPVESMKRSAYLTKGYRMKIFALIFITGFMSQLVFRVVLLLSATTMLHAAPWLFGAAVLVFGMLCPQAYSFIVYTVVYYDLRDLEEKGNSSNRSI